MLDKKELHRNNLTYVKMYPALFGQKQACENRPMCRSVAGYINALYNDEGFREDFEIFEEGKSLSEKKLNSLYSEQAYKRYKERYEETLEDLKIENDLIIQEGFKEYKFNSFESCFKYIKAIKDLLYHASVKTQEDAVIKLTSWIQWFRAGLSKDRRLKVDSSALFFFSALGGTGKSEILHSLAAACDELGIPTDYLTTADISDKFSPRAIKDANLIIIEDAEFISRLGNDINLHKLNSLIDRSKFTFIEKFKEPETITPNVTIIGATNNRYINRRYSNIIIK
ncbi:MAG: hypothetical protein LBU09_03230, partial [Endomicrobium sp.]|nr:hypothetical protein [Endomicrobium sp.]